MNLAEPWYQEWPELLTWELDRFEQLGYKTQLSDESLESGSVEIITDVPFHGESISIRVRYPSEYPELPPVIYGPPQLLSRHQHLFDGNFCLLPRPLDDWPAREWGAADLVHERLRSLLADSEKGIEAVRANEAPMPEPVSAFFRYAPDLAVLIPQDFSPAGESGVLEVRRLSANLLCVESFDGEKLQSQILDQFIANADDSEVPRATGKWLRVAQAPDVGPDSRDIANWIHEVHPDFLSPSLPKKLMHSRKIPRQPDLEIVGIAFPEESDLNGRSDETWMFLVANNAMHPREFHLLHSQFVTPERLQRRAPELAALSTKRALIFGAGSLGSDIAIELAKAGIGHIDIVDSDRLEAGNATRHALGLDYAGMPKASAVARACERHNPYCAAIGHEFRLGDVFWPTGSSPLDRAVELSGEADIIVDATGSHQVAQLLSRLAHGQDKPFITAAMTEGSWGGEITRISPGSTCCWTCFTTKSRNSDIPRANAGPPTTVIVQGCSHPTVTGAGFDAAEIAAAASRLTVQTLLAGTGSAYPDSDWDYGVFNFRSAGEPSLERRFIGLKLTGNEDCDVCRSTSGSLAVPSER